MYKWEDKLFSLFYCVWYLYLNNPTINLIYVSYITHHLIIQLHYTANPSKILFSSVPPLEQREHVLLIIYKSWDQFAKKSNFGFMLMLLMPDPLLSALNSENG